MRHHPISPVTEPMQYRAIGVVRGTYRPSDPEQLTRGVIETEDGTAIEAVVLGRVLTLMRRHLDLAEPHLWVVYPRSRDEDQLHLQLVGVWEPSTLSSENSPETSDSEGDGASAMEPVALDAGLSEADPASNAAAEPAGELPSAGADAVPEGDDYFSVRGELIFTRPESGDLVVKIRQLPRPDGSRPTPFKLQLKGEIPLESLRHFVALDLRRQGQVLQLERHEVIAPMPQRGNRGGKGRGSAGKGGGGGGRGAAGGSRQGAERGAAGPADRAQGERPSAGSRGESSRGDAPRGGGSERSPERGGSGRGPARGNASAISRPSR
jgi:hypothetical protein